MRPVFSVWLVAWINFLAGAAVYSWFLIYKSGVTAMAPLGVMSQASTSAEAALPLGWRLSG